MTLRHRLYLNCVLITLVLTAISGCSRPQGQIFPPLSSPLLWPQPPEVPRIAYVGSLTSEADLKPAASFSQILTETLFGKKEIGVLIAPASVVCDEQTLYVADSSAGVVHLFDMQTRHYRQISAFNGSEKLIMPVSITLADESVYVADSVLGIVCQFDKEGNCKSLLGPGIVKRPTGVAFSIPGQKLYVTDTANHRVNVFDAMGNQLFAFGSRGVQPGQFNFPTHLWADKTGKIYVSDTLNYRVQVFDAKGKFLRMFGSHGDRPGNFAHPAGVAADSAGHIYVVDKQYENIQIFDAEGNILMAVGGEGSDPGNFWLPAGIFISDDDRIYVADSFNKRIQIFEFLKGQDDEN